MPGHQTPVDLLQAIYDTSLLSMSVLQAVRDAHGRVQDFRIVTVNRELERETGRTDLVGQLYAQQYPGIIPSGLFALMLQALETGQPQQTEYFYPYDGFTKWFSCQFVKLGDGLVATNLDVTARKQAEEQRLQHLRIIQQFEEIAHLGSWEYDVRGRSLYWSAGMYHAFDVPLGSPVRPETYRDQVMGEDRAVAQRLVEAITAGRAVDEVLRVHLRGASRTLHLKALVLRDAQHQPVRLMGVALDVSQVQRLEQENLRLRQQQQQALFYAVLEAQEAERKRVAEALHNGVGQLLYATKLHLEQLDLVLREQPALRPPYQEAQLHLTEAIEETRNLAHELRPVVLEKFGLGAALRSICRGLSTPALPLHCELLEESGQSLPAALELALYRMAQELAHNIVKHARGATEARLEVETMPGWVLLRAEDNGAGFAADPPPGSGLGLRSIRDQVQLLGGTLQLGSSQAEGTYVRLRIPLPQPAA
ncbi:PAS domain-containing sensor histidine kinase [Hymenobacter sediminis]|uniref:PAS domain-containing sensor histidine kinase n=1 Tax=Hymenobacter sediminis TaxID=2218621 RepID=UPI00139027B4|nr:ATP-binding protein [Hymenobacter sediminis]